MFHFFFQKDIAINEEQLNGGFFWDTCTLANLQYTGYYDGHIKRKIQYLCYYSDFETMFYSYASYHFMFYRVYFIPKKFQGQFLGSSG